MKKTLFFIGLLGILSGLILSYVSWLELCTDLCAGTHNYRLLGMKFQDFGLFFFPLLLISHLLSIKSNQFAMLTGLLIAGALGSEVILIWIQKFEIKAWCPVCLGIAASIALAGLSYAAGYIIELKNTQKKEEFMKNAWKGFSSVTVFIVGILVALVGVTEINPLEAMQESVKENIVFGKQASSIEVYLFTDWQCPACRKLEPALHAIIPVVEKQAKLIFVDIDIHPETLNFTPYNLSFMVHNKSKYINLRDALTEISTKTGSPSEEQVEKAATALGVKYEQLNYADVAIGMKYFKHLGDEFDINSTPTLVLINRETKKGKKLYGSKEITPENIQKAIDSLK